MKFCIKICFCQKFSSASCMSFMVWKYCDFVTLFFVTFQQVSIGFSSGEYDGICSTLMRGLYFASRFLTQYVLWNPALSRMKTYFFFLLSLLINSLRK